MLTSDPSTGSRDPASAGYGTLCYPRCVAPAWERPSRGFGSKVEACLYFRAGDAPPVRCYPLLRGWLLPSLPSGNPRIARAFSLPFEWHTLSSGLGCFPLEYGTWLPHSNATTYTAAVFEVCQWGIPCDRPTHKQCSTPGQIRRRHDLNHFRRERAIAQLD